MVTAKEWFNRGMERLKTFKVESVMPALRMANEGAIDDVLNTNGSAYYQWLACLVDVMKPKQIVELGGAMGVGTIMLLQYLPADSKLYSITLPEHGLEFVYIADNYPNLIKVLGDDLDLKNWPKDCDLSKTDLLFIDTVHEKEHLEKELALYLPFLKKGAVVLLDDIHINGGMETVWQDIKAGKWGKIDTHDCSDPLHWSGFGLACI